MSEQSPGGALIDNEPWDSRRPDSLLPLKEPCRESADFGFFLRHYWVPATALTFLQSSRTTLPSGIVRQKATVIERRMARCRSGECLWREKTWPAGSGELEPSPTDELLCAYDPCEQTYVAAPPVEFAPSTPEQKVSARRQALYRLPVLCPPGPVPIGFCWYVRAGDDYMNFCLDGHCYIGATSVLKIRREGRYTTRLPGGAAQPGATEGGSVITKRQGVALFAWRRGVVLEDRFLDRIVEAEGRMALPAGTMIKVVTRLIRSCPETKRASAPLWAASLMGRGTDLAAPLVHHTSEAKGYYDLENRIARGAHHGPATPV